MKCPNCNKEMKAVEIIGGMEFFKAYTCEKCKIYSPIPILKVWTTNDINDWRKI